MLWKTGLSYAILTCSILAATIGYLLWSRKHVNRYTNRLLAFLLFLIAYIDFVTSLIITGTIIELPHFFRTAAPLNYLIGPLTFLYVRGSLFSTTRFDYRFGWLFIPALLNFIELTPFYAQSAAYKVAHLQALSSAPNSLVNITEGLLPPSVHLIGYTLSSLTYSIMAGWLLWTYLKHSNRTHLSNATYDNWIKTFVLIQIVSNVIWAIGMPFFRETAYANYSLNVTYVIAQLIICFYVIQRPTLLYGAYWLEKNPVILPKTNGMPPAPLPNAPFVEAEPTNWPDLQNTLLGAEKPVLDDESAIQQKLELLEKYMTNQQPYLQPRLSMANVSVATNIPPYLLSAMLNRVVGLDFRDYVNAHRVRHLCDLLHSDEYNHLTLEGISAQAGFSSKTTFYRAFQKHTGLTPAQYSSKSSQPEGK